MDQKEEDEEKKDKEIGEEFEEIQPEAVFEQNNLNDMKKTRKYLEFWNMCKQYLELLFEIMISYS